MNDVAHIIRSQFNTLSDKSLVARQDAMLRKTVAELAEFGNIYYEVCHEPYESEAGPQSYAGVAKPSDHDVT